MIELVGGDILRQDAEALVNTVNCVGVMGKGLALQFRHAFPANYHAYRAACEHREVQPGKMFVYKTGCLTNPRFIINFPTKRHWKDKSRLEDIEAGLAGLADLVRVLGDHEIHSVALPPLGCGLGGLDWVRVRPLIETALDKLSNLRVYLFAPCDATIVSR